MAISQVDMVARTVAELQARFSGEIILPTDQTYEQARQVWNALIDRRPALIARPRTAADVAEAVRFARESGLAFSVKGGGHNVTGSGVVDGGLMLDLSLMKGVDIDPEARVARAEGGALWSQVFDEAGKHGLSTTGGQLGTVGVGGFTLGGGIGWLSRKHGHAVDNLLSVEMVTADGEILRASHDENAGLFWAVRGGGGNFGVATKFEFRLHPVSTVVAGMVLHPVADAGVVLRFFREFALQAPDELGLMAVYANVPHMGRMVVLSACYAGDLEAGEAAIRPLREYGPPVGEQIGPMPYVVLQKMFDEGGEYGMGHHMRSDFLHELSDEAIDTIVANAAKTESPLTQVHIVRMGGAAGRVDPGETAFRHRDAQFTFAIMSAWTDLTDSPDQIAWTDEFYDDMKPFGMGGVYVNYLGSEGEERVREAYGENYPRLAELKKRYDPTNFFHMNQNIRPE